MRENRQKLKVILEGLLFHRLKKGLLLVSVREALDFSVVHVSKRASRVRGAPGGVLNGCFVEDEIFFVEGNRLRLSASLEPLKNRGHLVKLGRSHGRTLLKLVEIVSYLAANESFGFFALTAMMESFNAGFEAEGDEQTNRDGEKVDEEVASSVYFVVWRVDIEHGGAPVGFRLA